MSTFVERVAELLTAYGLTPDDLDTSIALAESHGTETPDEFVVRMAGKYDLRALEALVGAHEPEPSYALGGEIWADFVWLEVYDDRFLEVRPQTDRAWRWIARHGITNGAKEGLAWIDGLDARGLHRAGLTMQNTQGEGVRWRYWAIWLYRPVL